MKDEEKKPTSFLKQYSDQFCELTKSFFITIDSEGQILDLSENWTEKLGWNRNELRDKKIIEFIHPDDIANQLKQFATSKTEGDPLSYTSRFVTRDGEYRLLEWNIKWQGDSQIIVGVANDITNKLESLEIISKTHDLARIGSWTVDIQKSECFWSDITYDIHEVPRGTEIKLEDGINFYVPEHRDIINKHVQEAIEKGKPWDVELQILTKTGKRVWVRAIGQAVKSKGELIRLEGVFQDIDSRKTRMLMLQEKDERYKKLNERFEIALKASKVGIWDWDIPNNNLIWDENMYVLYGVNPKDFSGAFEAWQQGLHEEDAEKGQKEVELALANQKKFDTSFRIKWPDGQIRHIRALAEVVFDENNNPLRMLGANWDITKEVIHEQQLQAAKSEAESAVATRTQFLANMSHEIRTPLNGILGICSLLSDDLKIPKNISKINMILKSGEHLQNVINDILQFSKIESGKISSLLQSHKIRTLVHDTVSVFQVSAESKKIELAVHIDESVPEWLVLDGMKIKQILSNLVGNAVKFTRRGKIDITLKTENADQQLRLICSVKDTGIGLTKNQVRKIFDPFSQADNSTSRKFGGTGLGLSISKSLVEQLGGEIGVKSKKGEGSEFYFFLNCIEGNSQKESKPDTETNKAKVNQNLRVLVAEDNKTNQFVIMGLLKKLGLKCTLANNGKEALQQVKKSQFDIIFMDCHMPILDGFEATKSIAELFPLHERPYIIAATASVMENDIEKCLQSGMETVLAKPIKKANLINSIKEAEKALNKRRLKDQKKPKIA